MASKKKTTLCEKVWLEIDRYFLLKRFRFKQTRYLPNIENKVRNVSDRANDIRDESLWHFLTIYIN
jgi:hypothetical protein